MPRSDELAAALPQPPGEALADNAYPRHPHALPSPINAPGSPLSISSSRFFPRRPYRPQLPLGSRRLELLRRRSSSAVSHYEAPNSVNLFPYSTHTLLTTFCGLGDTGAVARTMSEPPEFAGAPPFLCAVSVTPTRAASTIGQPPTRRPHSSSFPLPRTTAGHHPVAAQRRAAVPCTSLMLMLQLAVSCPRPPFCLFFCLKRLTKVLLNRAVLVKNRSPVFIFRRGSCFA